MAEPMKRVPAQVSDKEKDLLKGVFKGNEYLLKTIRSLFYGFEITKEEKDLIKKTFKSPELKESFRKKIYPLMSNETPIGQLADFWLDVDTQVFGQQRDTIYQVINSKLKVKEMLEKSMKLLENPDGEKNNIEISSIELDPLQISLLSRNLYIRTIENGLSFIKMTADHVEESPAEVRKKAAMNSTK